MTGLLIVTHANLGQALVETLEFILDEKPEQIMSISIDIREKPDKLRNKIKKGIKKVKKNDGVIIFTDMFGGTPSNLSYSFLEEGVVEVISGVNLPLIFKAVNTREKMNTSELAATLLEHGKKSISLASAILKGTGRE